MSQTKSLFPFIAKTGHLHVILIPDLGLNQVTERALMRAGIANVSQLVKRTEEDIRKIKDMHEPYVTQVREKLRWLNLSFAAPQKEV